MILQRFRRLKEKGVLGINYRNARYALEYNKRRFYPRVDDKLLTKQLAKEAQLNVPELYGVIKYAGEVRQIHRLLAAHEDFVIKPARGAGGEGILVIAGRSQELYRKNNGKVLTAEDLAHHVFGVLSGMYSLGGHPDKALIEYRVLFDPVFEAISYQGVPDIRIIVFFGIPVMSMVRMPTQMSDGRANLHLGAIGAGVDLATGITLDAVWHERVITTHPDTGNKVSRVQIPHWDTLLALAARCYELTGIAYQGIDIVLDRDKGPLILEINARPGLNIQIANNAGLLPRLRLIEEHHQSLQSLDDRVAFAKQHFGAAASGEWRVA